MHVILITVEMHTKQLVYCLSSLVNVNHTAIQTIEQSFQYLEHNDTRTRISKMRYCMLGFCSSGYIFTVHADNMTKN